MDRAWQEKHELPASCSAVVVPDTLRALGDLAGWHRRRFKIRVVAVTGSNDSISAKLDRGSRDMASWSQI